MDDLGRIHRRAFESTSGVLFGLSIIAAAVRTTIRARNQGRLLFDDYLLLFACVNLIASNVLLYIMMETIYWDMGLILHPTSRSTFEAFTAPGFFDRIKWYQQVSFSFLTLTWTTIFAVKLSFLFFFRQMVDRLKNVMIYWKVVVGITVISYCYCAAGVFIACPKFGIEALQCAQGPGFQKNLAVAASEMALDIVTDLLIVSIPIVILWRVKIRRRQKIGLAAFLCLSTVMAVTAIVRMSGVKIAGTNIDVQWQLYWQEVEATVSVIMVSITAFRSLFGIKAMQAREKKHRAWYSYREKFLPRRSKKSSDGLNDNDQEKLPTIPSATMTGLRSFVRGEKGFRTIMGRERHNYMSSTNEWEGSKMDITVTHDISSASEMASRDGHTTPESYV